MHAFQYRRQALWCEEVPLSRIARTVGTPCYVYSERTLRRHFRAFDDAFGALSHITAFAVKANSNVAILRLFAQEGGGADVVSGGELYRALAAGIDPGRIVFAGVGKQAKEIHDALQARILMFNVESHQELELIDKVARHCGRQARVALRVNPDINPQTHPYISTGLKKSKFGVSIREALAFYRVASRLRHVEVVGLHSHIGSQITQLGPFLDAVKKILRLIEQLRAEWINIRYLDLGGGLGITYKSETPPHPRALAKALTPLLKPWLLAGGTLIFEPGRVIVGNAGLLLTEVLYVKSGHPHPFVVVDAGMNDLIRPSLYDAYHQILPVARRRVRAQTVDVVGPICESGDFLAKGRRLPQSRPGELLAVMSAGAYGFAMASNYNARPRAAEVLVQGGSFTVIRRRESYGDLIRGEFIPPSLKK
ncbi:MAG: diaminopimelate decarboxylase [Nitrospirae bacterium]|nr:diaminopimelate decarboxylase [Nitrospirota bacterium]